MITLTEILLIMNTPALGAILVWIVKVEKRLTSIEVTCRLKTDSGDCPKGV